MDALIAPIEFAGALLIVDYCIAGLVELAAESVRLVLQRRARQAGYRGEALTRITPHSLRAGCITTLAQASVHERDIMAHSRHGSQAVMRSYIRAAGTEEAFTSGVLWRCKDPQG